MTIHPIGLAYPNTGDGDATADGIRQNHANSTPLVITDADDIQDLDFNAAGYVVVPEQIQVRGSQVIYSRDPTSIAAHNGVTVLVSACEKRYTAPLVAQAFFNVLERTDTPPSASPGPAAGDRYIVGPAPEGVWASNADDLAFHDGQDWVFVSPEIGQTVYVRDSATRGDWQWGEAGTWTPRGALADTVYPANMKWPWGAVAVSEPATPPGASSPPLAQGTLYIVGVGATGAWADQDTDIAEADGDGGWTFHAAYNGAEIFDDTAGIKKRYNAASGAWVSAAGVMIHWDEVRSNTGNTTVTSGAGGYTFSDTTAPTRTHNGRGVDESLTHAAAAVGNRVELIFGGGISFGGTTTVGAALYVDNETTPRYWLPLHVSASGLYHFHIVLGYDVEDTDEHEHTIIFHGATTTTVDNIGKRHLQIREIVK